MWLRGLLAATSGLIVLAVATGAAAQGQADEDRGRFHFQAGASYYEAGDYEEARREFERAYEISKRPELFYNISLAYQQLGDLENAIGYLERYLDEVDDVPNRVNLERRLENLRERLAEEEEPPREPTDAEGAPPAEPGTDGEPAAGDAPEATWETDPAATPPPRDEAQAGPAVPAGAWVGWSIGAAGLLGGAIVGGLALSEKSDVESLPCAETRSCTDAQVDKMETLALTSDILLWGVGLGGAVVGTILFFVLRDDGASESEAAAPVAVQVSPWVDPDGGGGAVVGGKF